MIHASAIKLVHHLRLNGIAVSAMAPGPEKIPCIPCHSSVESPSLSQNGIGAKVPGQEDRNDARTDSEHEFPGLVVVAERGTRRRLLTRLK
jgi:hypothetical protein